jgi:hypothetical protein
VSTIKVDTIKNRAGTATITTADLTNAPAFEAILTDNSQTIADNTVVKVAFSNKLLDTNDCYDTTNYRFTPTVAGTYFVYARVAVNSNASANLQNCYAFIRKNGTSVHNTHFNHDGNNQRFTTANVNGFVTLNGSSDYVEIFTQMADSSGSADVYGDGRYSAFGGYKLIGV